MSETISTASAPPPPISSPPVPTLLQLCAAFALIALCGFGGVLAWSRRMLVEERRWMTPEEFNDAYALCQFLPGPNVVNLSVVFGRRIRGAVGSAVALLGLLGPPFVIVTVIGLIYAQFGEIAALQRMLVGVAAAAVAPAVQGSTRARPAAGAGDPGVGRRAALAAVLGAGRAHSAEHRDRLGAAMKDDGGILLTLAGYFAVMSLFAIGGANSAVPEMQRVAVEVEHWMTARQFSDIFAIAQVTPGPNVIIVTLIGYHVAGLVGALVATLAMCGPTSLFAFYVGGVWEGFKGAPWRRAIQAGLLPISIGLIAASGLVVASATAHNFVAVATTLATAVVTYATRLNPLWIFAAAALLGLGGLL